MKRGAYWIVLTCLIVTSLVLASCTTSSTTPTQASTTTQTTSITTTTTTQKVTTTTSTTQVATSTSTASTGKWWDKFGKPQYGGSPDRLQSRGLWLVGSDEQLVVGTITGAYMEGLYGDNWTLDPSVFDFSIGFRPTDYVTGLLAASWEFTSPGTYVVHFAAGRPLAEYSAGKWTGVHLR